ncbi:MAG: ATP-dependent DNA helicase RecG [Candidatus Andersenbacteria bacterium RIFCSPHIGHO2_12_FULL_45_11b]|uniref:Probable DNA 3'-5' helicase RecG n=1 Tax=Candidatus Andersenbacteria bacterium RIFCSPHIGHO2_12_FULL_45_11b TaxID=1797282 RepID=A0A1G1XCF5_9BACT|nr:MAG: ATP-dependent DNA helicase RecG [Candidatus Andersenbacteria bacterium RIFCSPHIGHO2_12_FULL_45_11b]
MTLSSPITELNGIGPARAKTLERLGITHVRDFLFTFPRKYEDFSNHIAVKDAELGKPATFFGTIVKVKSSNGFYGKRRLFRIYADIDDDTGIVHCTWFNLRFLEQKLRIGIQIYIAGTVEASKIQSGKYMGNKDVAMRSPAFEFPSQASDRIHTASIVPIYSETTGVSSRFIRYQVKQCMAALHGMREYMPEDIITRNGLLHIQDAIRISHFPASNEELEHAKHRLQFDELFFLQLEALVRRSHMQHATSYACKVTDGALKKIIKTVPFELTNAQKRVIEEIRSDMAQEHPMNRLLQGDVGSGKSAVALVAAEIALKNARKVLYLAPTELLARQQYQSFKKQLSYPVKLLIGETKKREREEILNMLMSIDPCCIIGTHALLQESVHASQVGLAIVDEQHRFGVAQRKKLLSLEKGIVPHLLSMTATPIPRTLSLTVYGDLDVSVLDELPKGRQPIATHIVFGAAKDNAIIHMLEELHAGRQAYIIAPVVEDSPKRALKSATNAYAEIKKLFPGIAIALLHGQMPSMEKESVMNNFTEGAIQVLVATAVVEVGVNIPNATIMMIEGAERFGLAQLHQFRGRIGRGAHASTCYVVPTAENMKNTERLKTFAQTTDGFAIAEADLLLRGPGEAYGKEQSGFGNLKVASLLDYKTISLARDEAKQILDNDPNLKDHVVFQKKVAQKNALIHFE